MIYLNYRDPRPIYIQIKDAIKRDISTGEIPPDGKLPSVRTLAGELAINPNTIQRAYRELEAEGFIYSVPGKGSFASLESDAAAEHRRALYRALDEKVSELLLVGESRQQISEHILGGDTE